MKNNPKQTQIETVLDHLIRFGSITSIEAIEQYKITRISSIIHNLRHRDKISITTEMVKQKSIGVSGREYSQFGRYTLDAASGATT